MSSNPENLEALQAQLHTGLNLLPVETVDEAIVHTQEALHAIATLALGSEGLNTCRAILARTNSTLFDARTNILLAHAYGNTYLDDVGLSSVPHPDHPDLGAVEQSYPTVSESLQTAFNSYRADVSAATQSPSFGGGSRFEVYNLPDPNKVLKIPQPTQESRLSPQQTVAAAIDGLVLGKGEEGLEQIVAYSKVHPAAIITERAPGDHLDKLPLEVIDNISTADCKRLLSIFQVMQRKGIKLDAAIGNMFYDPDQGFTVIDYEKNDGQTLQEKVIDWGNIMLTHAEYPDESDDLPPHALAYREACREVFGVEMVVALDAQWALSYDIPAS